MKRNRAKAVALGLALLGSRLGAEEPVGPPTAPPASAPNLLPAGLRLESWGPAGGSDPATVWLPARDQVHKPVEPMPLAAEPSALPPLIPAALAPLRPPEMPLPEPVGPRIAESPPPIPVPVTPVKPEPVPVPRAEPTPPPVRSELKDWSPVEPAPRPVFDPMRERPPTVLPSPELFTPRPGQPTPVPLGPPAPLPGKSPVPVPGELPVAPPELLIPSGWNAPGKHGTFGSAPIRLSRDYPPLADLIRHDSHPGRRSSEAGGAAVDRLQFQAEYLLWWVSAANYPVLATTTVAPGAIPTLAEGNGFLGDPATRVLLGNEPIGGRYRQGLRLRGGWWFDECRNCGVDASYFVLGRKTDTYTYTSNSNGSPVVTRPFFAPNVNPGTGQAFGEVGEIVAFPNFSAGVLTIQTASSIWGADVNFRHAGCRSCEFEWWWFTGFRFLNLSESLQATEFINSLADNSMDPAGTRVVVQDRFETRNRFYGVQVGAAAERNWGRVSLAARGSLALGNTHQELTIDGAQLRVRPGANPMTYPGGLLAVGPNIGQFSSNRFSVVPEATLNVGYWVTPSLKLYAGYNVLFWSNVVRPGDAIDRVVDVTFIPNPPPNVAASGTNRPEPLFTQSKLWMNGIQLGLEWRW